MKKCYLDSNVLINFKNELSKEHNIVIKKLSKLITYDYLFFISPLTIDEFLYVVKYYFIRQKTTHLYQILRKALKEILDIPNLLIVNSPHDEKSQLKVVNLMKKYSLSPRDAYHLLTMKYHRINYFFTFDNDFKAVFKEKILEPI